MKAAETASALIRRHIETVPAGEPFTSATLSGYGSRGAVDQALSRLVETGKLERVTRGVFVRPELSRYVGNVMPEPLKVAESIARSTGAVVQVHGAEAARRLELTTQVPTRLLFDTSGPSKRLHLGNLELRLQHVAPRKLALAGRPAGLALAALWYLGKHEVTPLVVEKIRRKLPPAEFEALMSATNVMPAWMISALRQHARHVRALSTAV
jgi:hypothetical protein